MIRHLCCLGRGFRHRVPQKHYKTNPSLIASRYLQLSIVLFLLIGAIDLQAQMIDDKDNDSVEDFADLDSDNDGIMDMDEGVECEVVDLDILFPMGSVNAIDDFNAAMITVGGVNGALIQVDTSFTGGATLDEFEISDRHTGDQAGLLLGVNSNDPSQTLSEIYSFSELVCDFSIVVFDLDRTDAITVLGTNGGTPVPFVLTDVGACIGFDGNMQLNSTCNNQVEPGSGDVAAHSFTLQFEGCIDEMTLTYFDQGPGNGGSFTFVPTPFPTCLGQDTDGDGIPDALDQDADNDGIPDAIEACSELNLVLEDCALDSNGDGIYQMMNGQSTGILVNVCPTAPIDTDNDGIPDFLDLDSDNDGCPDAIEACTNVNPNVNDSPDVFDNPAAATNECGLVLEPNNQTVTCQMPVSDNYVNDQIGCLDGTITLVQNIQCFGDNNGSAFVTPNDGNPPYTFAWSPSGETTQTAVSLVPGINTVTISDFCGATFIQTINIQEPPLLISNFEQTNVACNGEATGDIDVTVSGGTLPYSFLWNDGITTQNRINLPAGLYGITITDANNCVTSESITLTEPPLLQVSEQSINIACNGEATGSIDLSVIGGVQPYTFAWNDGVITEDRNNILAGVYMVTVTDFNGCVMSLSITLTEPPLLNLSLSPTDVLCNGFATGSINATPTGGTPPFSFAWNTGEITEDLFGLVAGNYTLTVTDANSCTVIESVTITEPPLLISDFTSVNVACNGESTGEIDLTVSGGTLPYSFLWNDGVTTEDRTNIPAGFYTINITDNNGCVSFESIMITEPPLLEVSEQSVNIACNGEATGSIDLAVTGGVTPYTFAWNDGVVTEDRSDLVAGTYLVTVTDANSCVMSLSVTLTEPTLLELSLSSVDVLCNGEATGSIDATPVGGTLPYSFAWSTGQTTEDLSNLIAGDYSLTITDANSCTVFQSVTITEPPLLTSTFSATNVACNGESTGAIDLSVTGGTLPYSFSWSDGVVTEDRTNIPVGLYGVTITDNNGCVISESITITEPPLLELSEQSINIACNSEATGSIDLTVIGGVTPYAFAWNDGITTEDRSTLVAGTYTVIVTDANNCVMSLSVTLTEPTLLELSLTSVDVLCNGEATGSIDATPVGGTLPYSFAWSTGQTTEDLSNLIAGDYSLTVTDANNCIVIQSVTITEPPLLTSIFSSTNVACNGESTGAIDLSISGGTLPYSFSWSDGVTTEDRTNIPVGLYGVTITDNNGCVISESITITEPPLLELSEQSINIACNGEATGSIDLTVIGGVTPYAFAWNDGVTTEDRNNLIAGTYIVTVTDANDCVMSLSVTLTEPPLLSLSLTSVDVLCNGEATGSIDASPVGGTLPLSFAWNTGQTTEDLSNLVAGDYILTITDANNCMVTQSVTITEPPLLAFTSSTADVACNGESTGEINLTLSGGTLPYSFLWNDGVTTEDRLNIPIGSYDVTITDDNGCILTESFVINEPTALELSAIVIDVTCAGELTGSIDITATGGVPPYTFLWNDGITIEDRSDLPAANYSVLITDANNCSILGEFTVVEPDPIAIDISIGCEMTFFPGCDAELDYSITGGFPPYIITVTDALGDLFPPNLPGPNWSNLCDGQYDINVIDAAGCGTSESFIVCALTCDLELTQGTIVNVSCTGGSDGSATVIGTSSAQPISYVWEQNGIPFATGVTQTDLASGVYRILATDAIGCLEELTLVVDEPSELSIVNCVSVNVSTVGGSDGSLTLSVVGGTLPYNFDWSNGDTTNPIENLPPDLYMVTVTDANGCEAFTSCTVQPISCNTFSTTQNIVDVACNGDATGEINISVLGSTGVVTFDWSPPVSTTNSASNLIAGTYEIVVTDEALCTETIIAEVRQPSALSAEIDRENVSCFDFADATLDLQVTGGVEPYTFAWSNSVFEEDQQNLDPDNYIVTVTDANNCTIITSTLVTQPDELICTTTSDVNAICGLANGQGTVSVVGGIPPYQYNWDNGEMTPTAVSLTAGVHFVTITDVNGCQLTCDVDIQQTCAPCLELIKSSSLDFGSDGSANPQDVVTYTYDIINCGDVTITDIAIQENANSFSGTGSLPVPTLPAGTNLDPAESITIESSYSITQLDIDAGFVDNQAVVNGNDPDGTLISDLSDTGNANDVNETGGPDDPTNTPILEFTCIEITKSSTLNTLAGVDLTPGTEISYSYSITNCGNVTLSNLSISETDLLFSGTGTLPIPSTPLSTTLAPGESTTSNSSYFITQADIDAGFIDNQAIAESVDPLGNPISDLSDTTNPNDVNETGGPDDPTNTPLPQNPCIVITKSSALDLGANGVASPGDVITYTYIASNCGNVTLSNVDILEDQILFSGTGNLPQPESVFTVFIPGQIDTITATYLITQADIDAGFVDNQALITSIDPAGNIVSDISDTSNPNDVNDTGGDSDPTNTPIGDLPCIEITKQSQLDLGLDNQASIGDAITYSYVITNCGNTTLSNISIIESVELFTGTGVIPSPELTPMLTLIPGESTNSSSVYLITQADIDTGFINNQAIAIGTDPSGNTVVDESDTANVNDPNETGGPDDPTFTEIPQVSCIELIKSSFFSLGDDASTSAGDTIEYHYQIINCGNVTISDLELIENQNTFSGTGDLPIPENLSTTTLAPGQESTSISTYITTQSDIDEGSVDNQATVTGSDPLGASVQDLSDTGNLDDVNETGGPDDPTNTPLEVQPCIETVKSSFFIIGADGTINSGDDIRYFYTITNCGNVTLSDVDIIEDQNLFSGTGNLPTIPPLSQTTLVPGQSVSTTTTYPITQQDVDNGFIDNQTITSGVDPDGVTISDLSDTGNLNDINETGGPDDPTNTPLAIVPCIELIKSSSLDLGANNSANPGDQITFTYEVINCGNVTISDVVVLEDGIFTGAGAVPIINPLSSQIIAPGDSIVTTGLYTLTQDDIDAGQLINQASVEGIDPNGLTIADLSDTGNLLDPNETGGPDDPTFTDIPQIDCIELIKSSTLLTNPSDLPAPGDVIQYSFEIQNCGNTTLGNVSLVDLADRFTGTGASFNLDPIPGIIEPGMNINLGATYEITQADIDAGFVDNQALVSAIDPTGTAIFDFSDTGNVNDVNETGGSDDPTNTPIQNIDCIELIKSSFLNINPSEVSGPGDIIDYTYEIINCGNTTLENIAITENNATFTGTGILPIVSETFDILLPGQQESTQTTYIITQADIDEGFVNNQATVNSQTVDGTPISDLSDTGNMNDPNETGGPDDPTFTEIGEIPCIEVLKGSTFISQGGIEGVINYTYTINNCGNVSLSNIVLSESSNLFTGTNSLPVPQPAQFSMLAVGASITAVAEYQITRADVDARFVDNQLIVTALDPQGVPIQDLSDTTNPNDINETGGPDDPTNTPINITSSVAGTVFEDIDGNMTEDQPIEGIVVTLTDSDGNVFMDITDANGEYFFEEVFPGPIVIVETDPIGFNSVGDSDGTNDNTIIVDLEPAIVSTDNDFIDEEPGTIFGNVSEDDGADGTADVPLENVLVTLIDRDGDEFTTLTDSLGNYMFTNVDPGPHTIIETDPGDFFSVSDIDGGDPNVIMNILFSGETNPDQDFLDAICDELVCNNDLQISLNVTCELTLTPDMLLEAPVPGDYTIMLFDEHGDFIRNDVLTAEEAGDTIMYQISCLDNSCWGTIIVEANIIPEIASPCSCTEDGSIPTECNLWCTPSGSIPAGIISPEEATSRFGFCGPDLLGDIRVIETRTGDICSEGGEIIELLYTGKVILHGQISSIDILCQRYSTIPISLDTTSFSFPESLTLDCNYIENIELGEGQEIAAFGTPQSILQSTGLAAQAFPFYENPHDSIPLIVLSNDTTQVIIGQTLRDTMVREIIGGVEEWVLKTVVHKVFADSISVVRDTVGITAALIPIDERVCNILSSFTDTEFESCGNGTKLIRTWELIDWCNSTSTFSGRQTIEIQDLTAPSIVEIVNGELINITTFDDVFVSIEPWRCEASVELPRLRVNDNCDIEPNIRWETQEGTVNGNFLSGLWLSEEPILVKAVVSDDCGNETVATFNYFVVDDVPPVTSCETSLQISLTGSASSGFGFANVYTESLDEGSHDSGCGKVNMTVIRAEDWEMPVFDCNGNIVGFSPVSCSANTEIVDIGSPSDKDGCNFDNTTLTPVSVPGDFVRFCCEDSGKTITVILFVEDERGNVNQCVIDVEIVDNSDAIINCEDITVDCNSGDSLQNPPIGGKLCASEQSFDVELLREIRNNDACLGGTVIREWFIDQNDNDVFDTNEPFCSQTVTVTADDAFDPNSIKWPKHFDGKQLEGVNIELNDEDEIVEVPATIEMGDVLTCSPSFESDPSLTIAPSWCDSDCGLIGFTSEIETIVAGDACLKLIRRWTIIDWCTFNTNDQSVEDGNDRMTDQFEAIEDWAQFDPSFDACNSQSSIHEDPVYFRYTQVDEDGYYTYDQIIVVSDNQAPTIEVPANVDINTTDGAQSKDDDAVCTGELIVQATAVDFCNDQQTASTELRWQVSIFNAGQLIATRNAIGPNTLVNSVFGTSSDVFTIFWEVSDGCGNVATSQTIVRFADQRAPTPFCVPGLTTAYMNSDGTVVIWGSEFDFGSFDNCTDSDDLRFSIVRRDETPTLPGIDGFDDQSSIELHCSEFNGFGSFDIWVWDEQGNGDFCSVDILLSDPDDRCNEEGTSGNISGQINTSYGMSISDAFVSLSSQSGSEFPKETSTTETGEYSFSNNPYGFNYNVNVSKEDDYLTGLSTLDLLFISRHILDQETFDDPYKILASDANDDATISVSDISLFRQIILGTKDNLDDQQSWLFVDKQTPFIDQSNPWPYTENIQINDFNTPLDNQDFVAIKMGDVNESYSQTKIRENQIVSFNINDRLVRKGETVVVEMTSDQLIAGAQFTLLTGGLELLKTQAQGENITTNHTAVHKTGVALSWNVNSPVPDNVSAVFTFTFKAKKDVMLSESIKLNSSITKAEAYVSSDLSTQYDIQLTFSDDVEQTTLRQNKPNPFSSETQIEIELAQADYIQLEIFNIAGKKVLERSGFYQKGSHKFLITENDLQSSNGILYYKLQVNEEVFTKKMMFIK